MAKLHYINSSEIIAKVADKYGYSAKEVTEMYYLGWKAIRTLMTRADMPNVYVNSYLKIESSSRKLRHYLRTCVMKYLLGEFEKYYIVSIFRRYSAARKKYKQYEKKRRSKTACNRSNDLTADE